MKKYWISSLVYGGVGLALGVYFREFTKFNGFAGRTSLAFAHPHALILGALLFLLLFFLSKHYRFAKPKLGKASVIVYHVGLAWTLLMMAVRRTLDVLGTELGSADGAIAGVAGIGHILLGVGLVLLLINAGFLQKAEESNSKEA